nr:hypothetical protein CFP56_06602 [Quercus suber]
MPQVLSPSVDIMADTKVEILIKEDTKQWDHGLIEGLFTPEEAKLIKSIPLSRCKAKDTLFWPFTSNGVYTIDRTSLGISITTQDVSTAPEVEAETEASAS